ncbi:MAG: copper chaperone PCu(A)C [Halioglobus sp.]
MKRRCRSWLVSVLVGGLCLPMAVLAADELPGLHIENAWIRAMPPGQRNTAAYLSATNHGQETVTIVGASTDLAAKAEMHRSREVDGYMRMEQLDAVPVPAGSSVHLTPGGIHLMLLGLNAMPEEGSTALLCLQLSTGRTVCIDAVVQKSGQGGHQHQH